MLSSLDIWDIVLDKLAKQIKQTAQSMDAFSQEKPLNTNFIPLRELSNYCVVRLFNTDDALERFVCFYLYSFINNVFSNIGGDTPYDDQLKETRKHFYKNLTENLYKLGNAIQKKKNDSIMNCLILSTDDYIGRINLLNEDFK